MRRPIAVLLSSMIFLAACASPAVPPTNTPAPIATSTSTLVPINTLQPTETLQPTATETPVEEIHMTLQDWQKFMNRPDEHMGNLNVIFDEKGSAYILSISEDAKILDVIRDEKRPMDILRQDGVAILGVTGDKYGIDYAKSELNKGSIVLVSKDIRASESSYPIMLAATQAYLEGDTKNDGSPKVTVEIFYDENPEDKKMSGWTVDFKYDHPQFLIVTDETGRQYTPIIPNPPRSLTLENSPMDRINIPNEDIQKQGKYWIEVVLAYGDYRHLIFWPKSNSFNPIHN